MNITLKATLNNKENSDGTYSVMIRITKDRQRASTSSGVRILKKNWNEKASYDRANWIRTSAAMHGVYNSKIKKAIQDIETIVSDLEKEKIDFSAPSIVSRLKNKSTGTSFENFATEYLKKTSSRVSPRTIIRYQTHLKKFTAFSPGITFEKINKAGIDNFINDCYTSISGNTIHRLIKTLRMIYQKALESDIISGKNPFKEIKIATTPAVKERLTIEEVAKLKDCNLSGNEAIARDVFLIQYYSGGVRISDILRLKRSNLVDGRIDFVISKTKRQHSKNINSDLVRLFQKYPCDLGETIIPLMRGIKEENTIRYFKKLESKTSIVNNSLHDIAEKLQINKKLSSHIARHSFADHLRQNGVPIDIISKALDHSTTRQTEVYLETFDNQAVDNAMEALFSKSESIVKVDIDK